MGGYKLPEAHTGIRASKSIGGAASFLYPRCQPCLHIPGPPFFFVDRSTVCWCFPITVLHERERARQNLSVYLPPPPRYSFNAGKVWPYRVREAAALCGEAGAIKAEFCVEYPRS